MATEIGVGLDQYRPVPIAVGTDHVRTVARTPDVENVPVDDAGVKRANRGIFGRDHAQIDVQHRKVTLRGPAMTTIDHHAVSLSLPALAYHVEQVRRAQPALQRVLEKDDLSHVPGGIVSRCVDEKRVSE